MNRRPHEPLDAEERALAARLPRPHGRGEPAPALDARILQAARDAVGVPPARKHARRRWIVPASVAATVTLALGVAWRMQDPAPAAQAVHDDAAFAAEVASPAASVAAEPAASTPAAPAMPPAAVASRPVPAPRVAEALPASAEPVASRMQAAAPEPARAGNTAPPPAPPAPPAPIAAFPADSMADLPAAAAPQAAGQAQRAMAPAAAKAATARERLDSITVTGTRIRNEAELAAEARMSAEADDDIPPATVDSPEVRDAWLRRIAELLKLGRNEEARESLGEFRRRYPDAVLPQELRALDPSALPGGKPVP